MQVLFYAVHVAMFAGTCPVMQDSRASLVRRMRAALKGRIFRTLLRAPAL